MSSPSSPRSVHFTAYTLARYAFWACNRPLHHIPTRWPLNWTNHDPHKPCRPSSCRRLRFAREKKEFEYLISNYAAWLWLLRDYPLPPFSPPPCLTGPSLAAFLGRPPLALSPAAQMAHTGASRVISSQVFPAGSSWILHGVHPHAQSRHRSFPLILFPSPNSLLAGPFFSIALSKLQLFHRKNYTNSTSEIKSEII